MKTELPGTFDNDDDCRDATKHDIDEKQDDWHKITNNMRKLVNLIIWRVEG